MAEKFESRDEISFRTELSEHIPVLNKGALLDYKQRERILKLLSGGFYPDLTAIAKIANTTRDAIEKSMKKDPAIERAYNSALMSQVDKIEQAAIDLAINGKNEVARQKSQEFLLKNLRASKYNEKLALAQSQSNAPRISVSLKLPVGTDNTQKKETPTKAEVVDVSTPPYE